MSNKLKSAVVASSLGTALLAFLAVDAQSAEMRFEHVMNIGSEGSGPGQFEFVEDFAFSQEGHLLATDAGHAFVQVFDATTGEYLGRFGGTGTGDEHLTKPEGIAVDDDGRIFIADYTTGDIKIYDAEHKHIKTFSEYGTGPGQNIKSEFMSIYNGRLYLPEAGNHRVDVFNLDGEFEFMFGGLGDEEGQMNNPESAKVNSEGTVFVADMLNHRIQLFDADGNFLAVWGSRGVREGQFLKPAGIAIDKDDNVYVTEIGNDRVQVFDKDGNFLTMFGEPGTGDGQFGNLHGMIAHPETGWLYIADSANDRIQVFRPVQ